MNNNAQQPIAARAPADSVTAPAGGDSRVPEAWTNLLAYVLQDDLHNRLTPRVIDIAYTAFMQAKRPNDEDGGASDWFNDTRPIVRELIAKLRKDLIEELVTPPAQTDSVQEDVCHAPPLGWRCTRKSGHEGPCAAVESHEDKEFVERGMRRIRDADDAARYRHIRDVPHSEEVRSVLIHQQNAVMDKVIDKYRAAMAAKKGGE